MQRLLRVLALAVGSAATFGAAELNAQPYYTDTEGYLDFRGAVGGGGNIAGALVGPYKAGFSTASMGAAYAASQFNVFCIDILGAASDSRVQLMNFGQATAYGPLVNKFADNPEGTVGGLTVEKLNQAAWLTSQFTNANQAQWKNLHHAIWGIFWDAGVNGYGGMGNLPALTVDAQNYMASAATAVDNGFDGSNYRVFVTMNNAGTEFVGDRQIFLGQIVTPEPSSYLLMATGLLAVGYVARRRKVRNV